MCFNVTMSEKSFPHEADDFPRNRAFYAESLKNDKKKETNQHLPDPGEETGKPGDLGGGYNSLSEGQITPPPTVNPYWPNQVQRAAGREGIKRSREALKRPKDPEATAEDPS